jgi:formylglycine-generating enzyme required for sulfatase activity
MGSPVTEQGRENRENQVNVKITKGFWMGKYEVTQEQWKAVMGSNPSHFTGDKLPVEKVSWNDVQVFIQKINEKIGDGSKSKVVLPTEAQWEYACRAGEKGPYAGDTIDDVAWYGNNSRNKTQPVGTKKPNSWGLHDMHGNVWEWCSDWYSSKLLGGVDPIGPTSGSHRVDRGGDWHCPASYCRASHRWLLTQCFADNHVGFRIARIPAY